MKQVIVAAALLVSLFFVLVSWQWPTPVPNAPEENKVKEIKGAIEWWTKVRTNDMTGVFDPADYYAAVRQADELSTPRTVNIVWEEMGPDNIGGRTRAIVYDRNNPGVVFAGGVSGGLWKSLNYGESWQKVDAGLGTLTVTCLVQAIDGTFYLGTGEGFYNIGLNVPVGYAAPGFMGNGIYKSTDGGATWQHLPSTTPNLPNNTNSEWAYVNKIACSPTDANLIYAATNKGLKYSTDGGATWSNVSGASAVTYAWDVKIGSDGIVHAIIGNDYYRSTQPNGTQFEKLNGTSGGKLPDDASTARIELAVAPSNPSVIYAVLSKGFTTVDLIGVYKSTDGGNTFTQIGPGGSANFNPLGSQGPYNIALAVHPSDEHSVYLGGQFYFYKYTPSLGWYRVNSFFSLSTYIHPDMHIIAFNPFNDNEMLMGTDGGIFKSKNIKATYPTFQAVNRNYNVTQFYAVTARETGEVFGGSQDNGGLYINFKGNTPKSAVDILGGDGMYVRISRTNPKAFFAENYAGSLKRNSNEGSGGFNSFFDERIDGNGDGFPENGADWIAPYDLWEAPDGSYSFLAFGTGTTSGRVWVTTQALNFSTDPEWFRFPLTDGVVTCLAFSTDGNILYVGTDNGTVYRYSNFQQVYAENKFRYPSINAQASAWSALDSGIVEFSRPVAAGRYLRYIAVDPHNPDHIVVVAARYGHTSYVWRSTNATTSMTFTDITGNLPKMPVWSACIDYVNPNLILIGTELGVYVNDLSSGSGWQEQNDGMDRVPVLQIIQVPYYGQTMYTYIASYGRGIFRSSSLVGTPQINAATIRPVALYPNPATSSATLRFMVSTGGDVPIEVHDRQGKVVYRTLLKQLPAGEHHISLPVYQWPNGLYLVTAGQQAVVKQKLVVLR
ncbi:MAG: T9SS type A sorting domain-containing protein [Chitinophagales bacterium]|nr:T9SS type A sorting domain-containing protein [Chitinophagales bacterium]MDW8427504.1 T9SS type A sorting domain-containing protein [Chitinophagales bacterium]